MKDSKKFHSDKKIKEVAEYIKSNAIAWSVTYAEHNEIDAKNIRKATIECMHNAVNDIMGKMNQTAEGPSTNSTSGFWSRKISS